MKCPKCQHKWFDPDEGMGLALLLGTLIFLAYFSIQAYYYHNNEIKMEEAYLTKYEAPIILFRTLSPGSDMQVLEIKTYGYRSITNAASEFLGVLIEMMREKNKAIIQGDQTFIMGRADPKGYGEDK